MIPAERNIDMPTASRRPSISTPCHSHGHDDDTSGDNGTASISVRLIHTEEKEAEDELPKKASAQHRAGDADDPATADTKRPSTPSGQNPTESEQVECSLPNDQEASTANPLPASLDPPPDKTGNLVEFNEKESISLPGRRRPDHNNSVEEKDVDDAPLSVLKQRQQQRKHMEHSSGSSDDEINCAKQQATTHVVTTTTIAANNDCREVRCRARRERPPKLRIPNDSDGGAGGGTDGQHDEFETDIEAFVSACIPVSLVAATHARAPSDGALSHRRTKVIHKRSLPLLSFLSSTHLAAAEKKRKKEEHERRNAIAEEEAKKALLRNPLPKPAVDAHASPAEGASGTAAGEKDGGVEHGPRGTHHAQERVVEKCTSQELAAPKVTTTWERTSNILMPPLLKDFLDGLENFPSKVGEP